ncbi:MAG: carbohydrate ABC transporter permease [Alphaproteobacteria bacterium]|jgi:multiple sugar transport system permease protein
MSMIDRLFGRQAVGWWFAGPGLLMLVMWQIAPIVIAGFMSVHRWKPIRDRYLGLQHYADLLGEWGPGILFFTCLSLLIGGVWLFGQPARALTERFRRSLIAAILMIGGGAALWGRNFLIDAMAVFPTLTEKREIRDFKRSTFADWRGDEVEQMALVTGSANQFTLYAALFFAMAALIAFLPWRRLPRWSNRLAGAAIVLIACGALAVAWQRMMIAGSNDFLASLINTLFYSVGVVFTQITIGLIIAFGLYRRIRGDGLFRYLIFLPYITPAVAMATVFSVIFRERSSGLMNRILDLFGVEPMKWLSNETPIMEALFGLEWAGLAGGPTIGLITVMLFGVWSYAGYNAVILLAGLTSIPKDLYEAAEIDGASRWQAFTKITLPLLSPVIFFLALTGLIGTFQAFNHTFVMFEQTGGRNESLIVASIFVFQELRSGDFGAAASMGVLLFFLILLITAAQFILAGRRLNSDL